LSYEKKLIIELDGGHHNLVEQRAKDKERQDWLEGQGFKVLRFWNNKVIFNLEDVLKTIEQELKLYS
jgi:very-short-patch-repair endonuclease